LFEAQALTDLVKEVYFPWLSRPEAIHAGQLILTAVSADKPGHKWITTSSISPASTSLPFSAGCLSLRLPSPSNDHATWSRSTARMIEQFGLDGQKVYDRAGVGMAVRDDKIEPSLAEDACKMKDENRRNPLLGEPAPAFPLG
jgi:hypothetical protein